ncbi:universal stress protein [Methanomicrobium antiquum]|uniref:Universal stress protein n=1 Tax=Methanomicrobium antiquum TaxID=487686 RepID=A0AAF0JT52_9EURY|nr:universal stress protein [Methanomicrobium antiquum]MDD3976854.1 universal stress protein [Methanomicrobium sp.]WFN35878.1 universal stress protein [Methanomicrobium antiquum]
MFKKILVPLDGSSVSEETLHTAIFEAKLRDSEIHAVNVINHVFVHPLMVESSQGASGGNTEMTEILEAESDRILAHAKDVCDDEEVKVFLYKRYGDPREEILNLSDEINADLIILGTKGKTNLERLLLGSVSSTVIMNSKITTLVIKNR